MFSDLGKGIFIMMLGSSVVALLAGLAIGYGISLL